MFKIFKIERKPQSAKASEVREEKTFAYAPDNKNKPSHEITYKLSNNIWEAAKNYVDYVVSKTEEGFRPTIKTIEYSATLIPALDEKIMKESGVFKDDFEKHTSKFQATRVDIIHYVAEQLGVTEQFNQGSNMPLYSREVVAFESGDTEISYEVSKELHNKVNEFIKTITGKETSKSTSATQYVTPEMDIKRTIARANVGLSQEDLDSVYDHLLQSKAKALGLEQEFNDNYTKESGKER